MMLLLQLFRREMVDRGARSFLVDTTGLVEVWNSCRRVTTPVRLSRSMGLNACYGPRTPHIIQCANSGLLPAITVHLASICLGI